MCNQTSRCRCVQGNGDIILVFKKLHSKVWLKIYLDASTAVRKVIIHQVEFNTFPKLLNSRT